MKPIASKIAEEWDSDSILFTDAIMLLALLDSDAQWIKMHAPDIRLIYSSPSHDDSEFSSLDTFTSGIIRIPSDQQALFTMEKERGFGTTTGGFLLFYSLHDESLDTARRLRQFRPAAIRESISSPFFEFASFAKETILQTLPPTSAPDTPSRQL